MTDITDIIDEIYEAAFFPEHWGNVLDGMARAIDAEGTLLFSASATTTRSLVSAGIVDLVAEFDSQEWGSRNIRAKRLFAAQHEGFLNDSDLFSDEEMNTEPMYKDFLRPNDFGFGAATAIHLPTGEKLVFSIEKKNIKGPVSRKSIGYLDKLRPHLARAAMMSNRLEFERINAAIEVLQLTGLPAAVLGPDAAVLASNRLIESFAPQVTIGARDHLHFFHAPAKAFLIDALDQSRSKSSGLDSASRSFPLPQYGDAPPAIIHLVPIRGRARDIFVNAAFFLIVTPVDRKRVPNVDTIQGLFDLSPAEARIARLLAAGFDVNAAAKQLSIGRATVRTHVKAILGKSGLTRQTDFVAAIASMRSIG